ncbi:DNA gyrase inhibitor YacG [Muricoccus radiodurans]|uniref:DNA gyrase inhibitor YacG n=1 Tax=Muricoccus radiodurans TaxID=2231721 RepID=UPI003CE68C1E
MPPKPHSTNACPICGKPAEPATRPFCSPRCRSVDLGRWLGGTYAIPGEPVEEPQPESRSER